MGVKILPTLGWFEDQVILHRMLDLTDPPSKIIKQEDIDFIGIFNTGVENGLPDLDMSFSELLDMSMRAITSNRDTSNSGMAEDTDAYLPETGKNEQGRQRPVRQITPKSARITHYRKVGW